VGSSSSETVVAPVPVLPVADDEAARRDSRKRQFRRRDREGPRLRSLVPEGDPKHADLGALGLPEHRDRAGERDRLRDPVDLEFLDRRPVGRCRLPASAVAIGDVNGEANGDRRQPAVAPRPPASVARSQRRRKTSRIPVPTSRKVVFS
jgi:hypothetical protein